MILWSLNMYDREEDHATRLLPLRCCDPLPLVDYKCARTHSHNQLSLWVLWICALIRRLLWVPYFWQLQPPKVQAKNQTSGSQSRTDFSVCAVRDTRRATFGRRFISLNKCEFNIVNGWRSIITNSWNFFNSNVCISAMLFSYFGWDWTTPSSPLLHSGGGLW